MKKPGTNKFPIESYLYMLLSPCNYWFSGALTFHAGVVPVSLGSNERKCSGFTLLLFIYSLRLKTVGNAYSLNTFKLSIFIF